LHQTDLKVPNLTQSDLGFQGISLTSLGGVLLSIFAGLALTVLVFIAENYSTKFKTAKEESKVSMVFKKFLRC
jgi:hypothetical protein